MTRAPSHPLSVAATLAAARRVTVKVGSSLLIGPDDKPRHDWLASLGDDIAALIAQGKQIVIVSSGAVALGRSHLGLRKSARLDHKQAAAAAGQALLMQAWERALAPHAIPTAQLLLTFDDTEQRRRALNARATLDVILGAGGLPVINENDSVATDELKFGDNDRLSARAAQLVQADLLILLSDIDGLYAADPRRDPAAPFIPYLGSVTAEAEAGAGDSGASGVGTGGMRTKLAAARLASGFGCATIIASGTEPHPLASLLAGARATLIAASGSPASAYKSWIKSSLAPAGTLTIDDGAAKALKTGKSLLPAGVTRVEGRFDRGACVRVFDLAGHELARGIAAYGAADAQAIAGLSRADIERRLGYAGRNELIHRDDLVML